MSVPAPLAQVFRGLPVHAIATAASVDVLAVLGLSVGGRIVEDQILTVAGAGETAWPFLLGLFLGWAALITLHLHPRARMAAFFPITGTVLFGLLLRGLTQSAQTPLAFVLVTAAAVTGILLGWRSLDLMVRSRGRDTTDPG